MSSYLYAKDHPGFLPENQNRRNLPGKDKKTTKSKLENQNSEIDHICPSPMVVYVKKKEEEKETAVELMYSCAKAIIDQ